VTTFSSTATSSFTAGGSASHWPRALFGYQLSILYQVYFTLQISNLNPLSGCFHSMDIHPYIRLLLSSDIHSQSSFRLILLCGYPLSILYQVDFTLRISTLTPISGCFSSTDIYSVFSILYQVAFICLNPLSIQVYIRFFSLEEIF
jgi:hypothetical protein